LFLASRLRPSAPVANFAQGVEVNGHSHRGETADGPFCPRRVAKPDPPLFESLSLTFPRAQHCSRKASHPAQSAGSRNRYPTPGSVIT
jgi:hypothetical protein